MTDNKIKIITRKEFLKLTGLTVGGISAGSILFSELMAVPQRLLDTVSKGPGKETWINTVCRQCPGGCGIRVRRIDGIPVYIKGNPIFPVNRGGVCPMAHASMEVLFNPDRVKSPLKRSGSKGRNQWEETDWDAALTFLTKRLQSLRVNGGAHKIAMINGDDSPLMRRLCRFWMEAIGSPNYFEDENLISNSVAVQLSHGVDLTPAYDLSNSRYILNFGSNFLEEGQSPVYHQQIFGNLMKADTGSDAILVHIDSRINLTASNADRWIPIRPGTYGALALGIAYVLIIDRLYDTDFIRNQTFGFGGYKEEVDREHMGFEAFVRANYYPEKVSEITGIPAETILELGEEFGTHQSAIAISDDASKYATNGSFTQWAVYCLNALVGNIQKKGGIYFSLPVPEFEFPKLQSDSRTRQSLSEPRVGSDSGPPSPFGDITVDQFAEAIVSGEAGLIDTLFIINSNPAFHSRQKETFVQALHKIENVVYLGIFQDETAKHCDFILPDHSYLEKTDISGPLPGLMFNHVGLQQPVIQPLFNTRQSGDVLLELGRPLLGSDVTPWKSYQALVQKNFEIIYDSGEGAIISESTGAEWLMYMKERGWTLQQYATFKSFQNLLAKNGGWWNPVPPTLTAKEMYKTTSGMFEFVSSTLEHRLNEISKSVDGKSPREKLDRLLTRLQIAARGDHLLVPHHEEPITQGKTEEFPLILTTSQLMTNRDGKGASQPSLLEMVGVQVGRYWDSWVEINPLTARTYGLHDREPAWIESTRGGVRAVVRLFPGIRPGVVHLHLGLGHTSYGRFGTDIGVNVTDVIENNIDMLSNIPALNGTRVKVSRIVRNV